MNSVRKGETSLKDKARIITIVIVSILGCVGLIYFGGLIAQFISNYQDWIQSGGMGGSAQMRSVNWTPVICFPQAFTAREYDESYDEDDFSD